MAVKKGLKYKIIAMLVAAVAAVSIWRFGTVSSALFDTNKAVHIEPDMIENSTLIIGTHLIYIHSLNDEIYNIALDSASASGQNRVYYKSELADGLWFDITDAGSLSDITTSGTIAEADEIAALFLTHHTKSDGITYDLTSNEAVCIFNIFNVYELESMPELEPLKMQYDTMKESNSSSKTAKRNLRLVEQFFALNVHSTVTDRCDEQLSALQGYYEELVANDAASNDTEMVLKVMEKVDNARKADVFTRVNAALSSLQDSAADLSSNDDLEIDDALLTAIGDSRYSVQESLSKAEGNMLAKGSTVISEKEYTFSTNMVSAAQSSNYAECDEQNWKLQDLDNITNSRIVKQQRELELLDDMIEAADIKYGVSLSSGASDEYNALVSRNASSAARQNRIKEDVTDTNAVRGELQFLIQGKVDRLEQSEAESYILMRIQDAAKFKDVIKPDDYTSAYQDNVTLYIQWLNELLSQTKKNGDNPSSTQNLYEQKANLQELKLKALDDLDLDTAKRIDARIDALDENIDAVESAVAMALNELADEKARLEKELEANPQDAALQVELSRVEAEIASNSTDLNAQSQTANIIDSKNEIIGLIAEGNTSEAALDLISNNIDMLTDMLDNGSPLALDALKEVYNKMLAKSELEDADGYQDLQENIEQAVSESSVNSSLTGEMSAQEAAGIVADSLGVDSLTDDNGNISDDVSGEDITAALIALGEFSKSTQTGGGDTPSPAEALTGGLASILNQSKDGYIFYSKKQGDESYVPAEVLANYLGYRYVWNDTKLNAVLSKGRTFYSFTAFRETVENEKGDTISMDNPAVFSGGVYIPGSFVKETFDCDIYDIFGTSYSVFVNDTVVKKSQEILSELLEKGGY